MTKKNVRVVSCGCCSNGCICNKHTDIRKGRKQNKCSIHSDDKLGSSGITLADEQLARKWGLDPQKVADQYSQNELSKSIGKIFETKGKEEK